MKILSIPNPFGAPVYYRETVSSTMDESRLLAAGGAPHGAVIAAGFQEQGRGRVRGRHWTADRDKNLFFTLLLRYPGLSAIPAALSLRTGLALSLAVEDAAPLLAGQVLVKWPNDLMIRSGQDGIFRKAAGILIEGDGRTLFIGIGVNVAQTGFPESIRSKATSILLAQNAPLPVPDLRFPLLERILARLYRELEETGEPAPVPALPPDRSPAPSLPPWRSRLEERLYMRGRRVRFIPGAADSGEAVEGILDGVGPGGELLLTPDGAGEARSFVTGELLVY
jgi:BirA family biotin operon repressor/biotin-[acetyl-CoA-carboxylase] ligase